MKITEINNKSKDYPPRLSLLFDPPKNLSVIGGDFEELLSMPTLGIVGSRKVSSYGRSVSQQFATSLARAGVCIISGLALGVDSIAHMSALEAGGKTIAVLPSGIKEIYPASHRGLARNIVTKNGALISEYKDDFRPMKHSFIERNRIIAALSDALLITEAAEKSGSLHTARFALEMGKTVLAVPGNITNPGNAGTNNLLKAGAVMVTEEQDIFDALNITPKKASDEPELYGDNNEETLLIKLLKDGVVNGDELLVQSEFDVQLFQQTLTMLELKGIIICLGNNQWRLN